MTTDKAITTTDEDSIDIADTLAVASIIPELADDHRRHTTMHDEFRYSTQERHLREAFRDGVITGGAATIALGIIISLLTG